MYADPLMHNFFIKFADETTVVALISNKDETDYRNKVSRLALWCSKNNLNVEKIKEMFVGFRLQASSVTLASIDATTPKRLSVHSTEDLDCQHHSTSAS